MPLFWLDSPRFFMQIHVVDSFFGLLEVRFVIVFCSTVEGQNSGTPFLLVIPEGARAKVRTRTRVRVRARTRNGGSAARCSNRWSWP